jgi:hypothetical protein
VKKRHNPVKKYSEISIRKGLRKVRVKENTIKPSVIHSKKKEAHLPLVILYQNFTTTP